MSTLGGDLDSLKALGHGTLGLVNAAILLAVVAVVLASGSSAVQILQNGFEFLAWLVGNTVAPVQGGTAVVLGNCYGAAGDYPTVATQPGGITSAGHLPPGCTTAGGAGTGTSATGATTPQGGFTTPQGTAGAQGTAGGSGQQLYNLLGPNSQWFGMPP